MAPFAAENDDDTFVVSMMNLPRSWLAGTNVLSSQERSVMTLVAGLPLILALVKSGYCVFEWLPQMVTFVTPSFGTPAFFASAATARLWSSRVIAVHRSAGTSRPLREATRQFGLHGFPTISTRTSLAALLAMAFPWPTKICPFLLSRSFRSMPGPRGA